jgi:hypothetical protein
MAEIPRQKKLAFFDSGGSNMHGVHASFLW